MRAIDVSHDDAMVVDNQGSIWIWKEGRQSWGYITDGGETVWDFKDYLPEGYEPYARLDDAAQLVIRRGLP